MKPIPINNNLFDGDCGLWYDVTVICGYKLIHCVCPYSICKTFEEAIAYYWEQFHKEGYNPIQVCHHKYPAKELEQLALAC